VRKSFLIFLALLLVTGGFLYARQQRRDTILGEARMASSALGTSAEAVKFRWEYEGCPPENQAIYAEWTRRLADAKALSSRAVDVFGSDDPDIQMIDSGLHNQSIAMSDKHIQCLVQQGKVLDRLARRR
jgi:hypothetical protein